MKVLQTIRSSRTLLVLLTPLLLGSLSVFSFAPFNFTLINFFIFPALFLLLSDINKRSKNIYRKKPYLTNLFFAGYFFGFGFFLTGTYWISNSLKFDETFQSLIPLTIVAIPAFLGIFYGISSIICGPFLKRNLGSVMLFIGAFSFIDYIRSKIFSGFPWNLWGYSWSWFTEILQILNPIGLFAFNLLSVTFFTIPVILSFTTSQKKIVVISCAIFLFFSNYIYGNYTINNNFKELKNVNKENYINFKIISPNFELKYNLSTEEIEKRILLLIRYSDPEKEKKTIFIWPEGAISGSYLKDLENYKHHIKKNFSDKHIIIFGTNTLDKKDDLFFNSLIAIDNNFEKIFQYNKIKLVPFGEYLPIPKFFETIGLKKITEGYGSFSKGNNNKVFSFSNTQIIPLICYEIIFPELLQKTNLSKKIVLNLSEDAWFGNSIGPYQHFAKTIFRAIESNSFVVRSANKGITAFVNNNGQVIKSLKINETGNLEYKIPIAKKQTKNKNDLIFFMLLITYILIFITLKKND
jgi:apolipoprotein N-acyltransferase|tara:strand:- start:568 stop:2133 length:1566 start_codon:yes stop_codon:yes gene_type:complete